MSSVSLIPAAQYLRMSTEHQWYSLENQSLIIDNYAERHGFSVIQTYADAARTEVIFRCREGLKKLIRDVVQGAAQYKVILVYDVSRWGRFQDCDEAAYYEFICKSAGIPVHYCSETFSNDNAMPNVIMKSLKRAMAGEYSRELGMKVYTGQKTLAKLGFRQGGFAGYGLRRMLLSADGTPKQLLKYGERKCIATDRVILVLGPDNEVQCVRGIYDMFIRKRMGFRAIARALNRRGVAYLGSSPWNERAISAILTHPKYAGYNIYGQYTQKLYTQCVKLPRSEWTVIPGAFEPLVTPEEFT